MSKARGQDWALPTRTPGATAYRRPIRIVCSKSHYLVYSGAANQPPTSINITPTAENSVEQLVNNIWKLIESWGMAEVGGYWKPVLRLSATPDGVHRAKQLATLLEGSGIEIESALR